MSDAVSFRPMTEADLDAVLKIEYAAYSHPWTRGIFLDGLGKYQIWLMFVGEQQVGHGVVQIIRDEALALNADGAIAAATGYNDIGFNSFFRTGWKRFHLYWYGKEMPSAQLNCPKTVALLKSIPSIKAAMFASLPPGATHHSRSVPAQQHPLPAANTH